MNKSERIKYLKTYQLPTWINTRKQVFEELSNEQSMFCCCGKLATGLHEQNCRKFNAKVDNVTVDRLKNLESEIERLNRATFLSSETIGEHPTGDSLT